MCYQITHQFCVYRVTASRLAYTAHLRTDLQQIDQAEYLSVMVLDNWGSCFRVLRGSQCNAFLSGHVSRAPLSLSLSVTR